MLTLSQALEQTRRDGSWLLVYATSAASDDGRLMDRATMSDARIGAWIKANGIGITIDVDIDRSLANELGVGVLPTCVAFESGVERERLRGLRSADVVLLWLHGLTRKREEGLELRVVDEANVHSRGHTARALLRAGKYAEALDQYVWLWNNMARVEPTLAGVRRSFVAQEIDSLVRAWPSADERFSAIRDEVAGVDGSDPRALDARLDWIVLNSALGHDRLTLSWFDSAKANPKAQGIVKVAAHLLMEPLRLRNRWADLGGLYADPMQELAFQYRVKTESDVRVSPALPAALSRVTEHVAVKRFRVQVGELCASLRAAGRTKEAMEVENEALSLDSSDEMRIALRSATAPDN